jgi:hypothetical protein
VPTNVHHRRRPFAGRLVSHRTQAKPRQSVAPCLCRSQPAGEWCLQTCITACDHSLAGQLPQNTSQTPAKALHLVFVGASLLANRAGKRASPQANIRWQAISHKIQAWPRQSVAPCLCRSQPAGEWCRQTCTTAGEHSLAGLSPTEHKPNTRQSVAPCLCRSQPAGEWCRQTCITAGEHSLAGQLPQNTSQTPAKALHLVFVGASLLANRAGKCASPQANIRWQANSHRGQPIGF